MPFPGDLLCAACTRSEYDFNYEIRDVHFESGGKPDETTYCSPWLLATLKTTDVSFKVGTTTKEFTDTIAADAVEYVDLG